MDAYLVRKQRVETMGGHDSVRANEQLLSRHKQAGNIIPDLDLRGE